MLAKPPKGSEWSMSAYQIERDKISFNVTFSVDCLTIYLTNALYIDREEETGQEKGQIGYPAFPRQPKKKCNKCGKWHKAEFLDKNLKLLVTSTSIIYEIRFCPSWHSQQDMRLLQEEIPHWCI